MLTNDNIRKIEEFVFSQPRSVQEISELLKISWRTADRFIEEIKKERGSVETKVFRGGTRGALKIVFWASAEKASKNIFQEELEKDIFSNPRKEDFSAFDIFQHVSEKEKFVKIDYERESEDNKKNFFNLLKETKKQVLCFSGNLSFINAKYKSETLLDVMEILVKRGISIKIICRVDVGGIENVKKLISLNYKHKSNMIEIKHRQQALRAFVIDGQIVKLKEEKEPTGKENELNKRAFIFYTIKSRDWASWFSKIFWNMFSKSIGAEKRLEELEKIKS